MDVINIQKIHKFRKGLSFICSINQFSNSCKLLSASQALCLMLGNTSNLTQGSHSEVLTAPTSSLPGTQATLLKWFAVTTHAKLPTFLMFLLFLTLYVSKMSKGLQDKPCFWKLLPTVSILWRPHNMLGLLPLCSIGPACTNDRTLSTLLCSPLFICLSSPLNSEQLESRTFSLIIGISQKPVSECGRTQIGKKGGKMKWNERKWNELGILGKWAPEASLSASYGGAYILLGVGWEVLCLNMTFKHIPIIYFEKA